VCECQLCFVITNQARKISKLLDEDEMKMRLNIIRIPPLTIKTQEEESQRMINYITTTTFLLGLLGKGLISAYFHNFY
jgi:hypothetical protein